jgi:two-component system chemotaxis response regulator CheB
VTERTTTTRRTNALRVLVVDDSPANQDAITQMLSGDPEVEVVGCAGDGEDALRQALALKPSCICLDLQMPRMDGFTFLRLLMARQPTPVVVVSSNSRKQEVFKALELGALEFVAKPDPHGEITDLEVIREDLLRKIGAIRRLRTLPPEQLVITDARRPEPADRAEPPARAESVAPAADAPRLARRRSRGAPARLIVIGASTGGPPAVARLLAAMPRGLPIAYAVAQHMPERFTTTFAERLARSTGLDVREAADGDEFVQGRVLVAPGGKHLKVVPSSAAGVARIRASVVDPDPRDGRRYCPSVDLLFESAAEAMGDRVCAVVLTGMGSDGRDGIARVKEAGGLALAESQESAVVFGMPKQAVGTGKVDEVLSLEDIATRLRRFAEQKS